MKRLNITVEGFSEEKFITDILRQHLLNFGIYAEARKALTNRKQRKRGGIVSYEKFKADVVRWCKESPQAWNTTFIDLYGLDTDFPGYFSTKGLNPYGRVAEMEHLMAADILNSAGTKFYRFIPYIQLHEYEALLFADTSILENWLSVYNKLPENCFTKIKNASPDANPELINENPETAPSKRILSVCSTYDKVNDGILILKEIGLNTLRKECRHFDDWLAKLEEIK